MEVVNYCFCRNILQIEVLYHVVCTPARVVHLILGEKYFSSGVELPGNKSCISTTLNVPKFEMYI